MKFSPHCVTDWYMWKHADTAKKKSNGERSTNSSMISDRMWMKWSKAFYLKVKWKRSTAEMNEMFLYTVTEGCMLFMMYVLYVRSGIHTLPVCHWHSAQRCYAVWVRDRHVRFTSWLARLIEGTVSIGGAKSAYLNRSRRERARRGRW